MKQGIIFAILAVILIAGGIYYSSRAAHEKNRNDNNTQAQNTSMDQNNASALQIEDVKTGTGPAAKPGDTVTVHYTGTFADGRKFDSSLDRDEPFTFTLGAGNVIQGWDEGVAGMQAGGTRKLIVPPELGYGPNDYGPIPGGSTLYFTVELLEIAS